MREDRLAALDERIELLIMAFPDLVAMFQQKAPFRRFGQLEYHCATITARREAGSSVAALRSSEFLKLLYCTLKAWGIGVRGSHLVPFPAFESTLRAHEGQIASLEKLAIDDAELDVETVREQLWQVLDGLKITDNKARLVPCTKALHHILPDLVVPIDREYTQKFFGWHSPEFQDRQRECFRQAFEVFTRVARAVGPGQFVGPGWNTSKTKVIDNAIVGLFVKLAELAASRT